jgi:HK97 gp10 family phage protein
MGARVTIKGLAGLRDALDDVRRAVRRGAERAVRDEVADLAGDMREHAARGDASRGTRGDPTLVESIDARADGLSGTAGPEVLHALFVEHGTSSHPAQPFVLPAGQRARRRFPKRVAGEVSKELR